VTSATGSRETKSVDEILDAAELREKLAAALREIDRLKGVPAIAEAVTAERVDSILKARRLRDEFFGSSLFADPAWDILLELYVAELKGIRRSVSAVCIGAAVPLTTALRWIRSLEKKGLLVRTDDYFDGRRSYISLAPEASERMAALLEACPPTEPLI
jgi:DNA-binding MarR family transcriptional regulator